VTTGTSRSEIRIVDRTLRETWDKKEKWIFGVIGGVGGGGGGGEVGGGEGGLGVGVGVGVQLEASKNNLLP